MDWFRNTLRVYAYVYVLCQCPHTVHYVSAVTTEHSYNYMIQCIKLCYIFPLTKELIYDITTLVCFNSS